jgi:filamentous hemagglutinin family protein
MKPLVQNNIISYKWQDFNIAKDETVTYKEIQDIRGVLQDYK